MKRYLLVLLALVLVLSLLLSACSGGSKDANPQPAATTSGQSPRGVTGTISTGQVAQSSPIPVTTQGGRFTLNKPGEVLNGLQLAVPPGSYDSDKQFAISYAPIEKHTFGENFNPITPLIKIDNGGAFSNEIMEVTIPCQVSPGYFAMGFIYDEKTKTLEGLPTLAQDASSITVGTRHFSDLLITQISDSVLQSIDIDSGFRPGIDDWQFTNYGSYIARGGHCTGQSMTAMWYYETQPDGKDLTLYNRYDNNGSKPATPALWEDDSYGYRFASVVWKEMDWASLGRKLTEKYIADSDKATWNLFAYSMLLNHQPQMVEIWNTKVGGGHAMIVYRINKKNLYIADPNYPGSTDRRIEFDGTKFKPYNSGENAEEIAKGNGKEYDRITFCFKTSLSEWSKLAQRWQEVKSGTIGNGIFPNYKIVYKDSNGKWPELKDGYVSTEKLIAITTESITPNTGCYVHRDGVPLNWDAKGNYELRPGANKLGFYIVGMVDAVDKNGNPIKVAKYIDFKYLTITYEPEASPTKTPSPTPSVVNNLAKLQKTTSVKASINSKNTFKQLLAGKETAPVLVSANRVPQMTIAWKGTSFSGTVVVDQLALDFDIPGPYSVSGTVSADGNTLLTLNFTYSAKDYYGYAANTQNYASYTRSIQLQNVPLDRSLAEGLPFGIFSGSGSGMASYVVKIENKKETYKNGSLSESFTYLSTDWSPTDSANLAKFSLSFN